MFGSVLLHLDGDDRAYNIGANERKPTATATTALIYLQDLGSRERAQSSLD